MNPIKKNLISKFYMPLALVLSAMSVGNVEAVDFDGDGKSDHAVLRPVDSSLSEQSVWYILSSGLSGTLRYQWGLIGDIPVPGKFFGGNGSDIGVFRPENGTWYIRKYNAGLTFNQGEAFQWGLPGDKPIACDFNGNGRSDLALYRPSLGNWFVRNTTNATGVQAQQWGGLSGDIAVPMDYDSDGKCDFTIFRDGSWYVLLSSTSPMSAGAVIPWGEKGDIPVPGQYDGDSILDFAVYRPSNSTWYIRRSNLAGLTFRVIQWGLPGDLPVAADFTGNGKTDIGVFRPSDATFYILTNNSDYKTATVQQFGLPTDTPIGAPLN
jgi:hypothetical protein